MFCDFTILGEIFISVIIFWWPNSVNKWTAVHDIAVNRWTYFPFITILRAKHGLPTHTQYAPGEQGRLSCLPGRPGTISFLSHFFYETASCSETAEL